MSARWQLTAVTLCLILAAPFALHADIYRWDNGQVIPGTEGITPGPGVQLDHMELEWANFSGMDLTGANFEGSNLTGADFANTNLRDAQFGASSLAEARFLASNLSSANFEVSNLTDAGLYDAILTGANLTGAVVTGARFGNAGSSGLTKEQLYSTASYRARDLHRIRLQRNDLSDWDLSGQDLTGAYLWESRLTNADFTGTVVTGASFYGTTSLGFTKEQLYSTTSYRTKNLQGIELGGDNLTGWDFSKQDLTNAGLYGAVLENADFSGANLKNIALLFAQGVESPVFDSTTVYNQWTQFPTGFDPQAAGLRLSVSLKGDFNANDLLDAVDVDWLSYNAMFRRGGPDPFPPPLPLAAFDLNNDTKVDTEDHRVWVQNLKNTWYGDANLDGEFNSSDLLHVFSAGKYEQGWIVPDETSWILHNDAGWSEGDWNGDLFFDSSDFITAFQDGGYEQGQRTDAAAVPEPTSLVLVTLSLIWVTLFQHRAQSRAAIESSF